VVNRAPHSVAFDEPAELACKASPVETWRVVGSFSEAEPTSALTACHHICAVTATFQGDPLVCWMRKRTKNHEALVSAGQSIFLIRMRPPNMVFATMTIMTANACTAKSVAAAS
jgi:hypothetical protein